MRAKVLLLIVMVIVIAMTVMTQTTSAVGHKSSNYIKVQCRTDPKNAQFLRKDHGWKISRDKDPYFLETADFYFETDNYRTGIRGIRRVLPEEDARFIEKGLEKAFSEGQRLSSLRLVIDGDTGEISQAYIHLKKNAGRFMGWFAGDLYDIDWYTLRPAKDGKNGNGLLVKKEGPEEYSIKNPNSNGYFFISPALFAKRANMKKFISYFGIQDDCSSLSDCL